ncbi:hypothetical protein [Spiroplasma endosymbiont of Labia minor]|uniref:oxidoreductase n=1 Tax=Spiroplasma endosymbiont of Labia minor TaxID=3066305 RepID=UPI0030CD39D8
MKEIIQEPFLYRSKNVTFKNRIAQAAISYMASNTDGTLSESDFNYYKKRIDGQGLVYTPMLYVHESGKIWQNQPGISDDSHIPGLAELIKMIKNQNKDVKIIAQISHGGAIANPIFCDNNLLAPSPIVDPYSITGVMPREINLNEIKQVIEWFKQATKRAIEAGFDGVEISAAAASLIKEFISPNTNIRTDEYGYVGVSKYKFATEIANSVTETIKKNADKSFLHSWSTRLTDQKYELDLELSQQFIQAILPYGVDMISLTNYSSETIHESQFGDDGIQLISWMAMQLLGRTIIAFSGSINGLSQMEYLKDVVDIFSIGRGFICNPNWFTNLINNIPNVDYIKLSEIEKLGLDPKMSLFENNAVKIIDDLKA